MDSDVGLGKREKQTPKRLIEYDENLKELKKLIETNIARNKRGNQ